MVQILLVEIFGVNILFGRIQRVVDDLVRMGDFESNSMLFAFAQLYRLIFVVRGTSKLNFI